MRSRSIDVTKLRATPRARREWTDRRLVGACLDGDDRAWAELVDRYRNLVFSLALKRGLSETDAADLVQAVWTQAYIKLESLRELDSIRPWLTAVTLNAAYHWQRRQRQLESREAGGYETEQLDARGSVPPADPTIAETQLRVQQAITELPDRCQELIRLLFYHQPPLPYREVASRLGLAVGSIGFIRGRCLKKLHRLLAEQERSGGSG